MVLPLLLIMVLPKLMNAADPEAQKVICFVLKYYVLVTFIAIHKGRSKIIFFRKTRGYILSF